MDRLSVTAPAKVNLRLEVDPPREDGYHPIRSLMATLPEVADTVTVERSSARRVDCEGVAERENLAWRALDALERHVGPVPPVAVRIDKRIPREAGLGGGSSDAAAVLVAVSRLLGLGLAAGELERVAAEVGSDVPFFVRGGVQWARGRGEQLEPSGAPEVWVVLARPPVGLSTAAVYRAFDRLPPPPPGGHGEAPDTARGLIAWCRNDLWGPALALAPRLGGVARTLRAAGAARALLCGSGSTVAGLVVDEPTARAVAERVSASAPGLWLATSPVASAPLARV